MTTEQEERARRKDEQDHVKALRVNEVCVKEWELKVRAKEYLKQIKKKTKLYENLIIQDGSLFFRDTAKNGESIRVHNNPYSRKGIFNHSLLVKNASDDDLTKKKFKNFSGAASIMKRLGEQEKVDKKNLKLEKTWKQSLRRGDLSSSPPKVIQYHSKAKQAEAIARELLDTEIGDLSNYKASNEDNTRKGRTNYDQDNTTRQPSRTRGFNTAGVRSQSQISKTRVATARWNENKA